jgi:pyruvate/2-oxoglutarate dehydrogenase complex dihydrolipoamide acyltransferase (E2) component
MDMRVPAFGHGLPEALLVEWVAGVGDQVERGDVIAVVETDKASTEIVAVRGGRVTAHSATVGTILRPGEVLYQLTAAKRPHAPGSEKSTSPERRRTMSDIESRVTDTMLAKLRERDPSLSPGDLARPVADLDLDSLDLVELHQQLERELQVKGDLTKTAGFAFLDDFSTYFVKLASRG